MTPTRDPRLDALRGVAILLVLGNHAKILHVDVPRHGWGLAMRLWERCGWCGVDLFFVLSGFLVSGLLFREYQQRGELRIWRFLVRRAFKIYPSFYLLILVGWIVGERGVGNALTAELLFIQDYVPGIWTHTWSLGVEEKFYLLLAGFLWFLSRRHGASLGAILPTFGLVAIVALAARIEVNLNRVYTNETHVYSTHLRLDALSFGVLLSYLTYYHGVRFWQFVGTHRRAILVGSILLLVPALAFRAGNGHVWMNGPGLTATYLGFGGVLVWTLATPSLSSHLAVRAIASIGVASYSIYVWHLLVVRACDVLSGSVPAPAVIALYLVSSIAVGLAMFRLWEQPMLRLREITRSAGRGDTSAPEPDRRT